MGMGNLVELVPPVRVAEEDYEQPTESIVDISDYDEMALMVTVWSLSGANASVDFYLSTALENREDNYVRVRKLFRLDQTTFSAPFHHYSYWVGPGQADSLELGSAFPAIARYARIEAIGLTTGESLSFSAKAFLRNR